MDFALLTTGSLVMMHEALAAALASDDQNPSQEKEYGVRSSSDWREWGDKLEAELSKREQPFHPLGWDSGNA